MNTLLVINSSGRVTRSITRHLTARFVTAWSGRHPRGKVVHRDVGLNPPPSVDEPWIASAYGGGTDGASTTTDPLTVSETLIAELMEADVVVLGAPMYNFGMPASLKAWIDQVVRVNRTFAFDPAADPAYRPLLAPKPVLVVTSAGDGAVHPGGELAHLNHLEPHLSTALGFIGLTDLTFIRAGYDEYEDDRAKRSLATAEAMVDREEARLSQPAELSVHSPDS